ncbi:MAG: DNA adenine methylase [Theionarchaea archaeon]|nr:MAG: hypothetical protein AYK18_15055 [Theionarchaea archaeon DG-70]MBU7009134.1 DNA adenine methylase [Theionarchaea archaeon]
MNQIILAWERLQGVWIDQLDYQECLRRYDSEKILFFVDPPYFRGTKPYKGKADLEELSAILKTLKGKFILTIDQEGSHIFDWIQHRECVSKKLGIENRKKVRKQREVIFWNYELNERFTDLCQESTRIDQYL